MADVKITDMSADASVTGVEILAVSDGASPKRVTITQIKNWVIDQIEAITAETEVDGNDKIYILDNTDSALQPVDIDTVLQHGIDAIWAKTALAGADAVDADVMLIKDGGTTEKTITLENLAIYMLAELEPDIINVSDVDAAAALAGADFLLVTQSSVGKRATLTSINDFILGGLDTYLAALNAVTVSADADLLYCTQGGSEKKLALSVLKTYMGGDVTGPATSTTANIPQWADANGDTLTDGIDLATSVGATGTDAQVVTEQGIREALSTVVYDQTDIGEALVDADTVVVDNGALGTTQRKSALSRVWTYIDSKMPEANLTPAYYQLEWVAGQRGKPGINADILSATEATRMVTDPYFEVLGNNGSSDDVTYYAEGGITLTTDGADGDEVIILPHLDSNQSPWGQVTWGSDQEVIWECRIRTDANITNCIIWAGLKLTNTEVTATDADQVFFRYEDDNNNGEWEAISSIANSDDEEDTDLAVVVNTDYHLRIKIQADRTALMYINGTLHETTAALTDATDFIPYIGVAADGAAAAKILHVRSQAIRRKFA